MADDGNRGEPELCEGRKVSPSSVTPARRRQAQKEQLWAGTYWTSTDGVLDGGRKGWSFLEASPTLT